MKKLLMILLSVFLFLGIAGAQNAFALNVAQGANVSLTGNFFTEYQDWSTSAPDGSTGSQALVDSIVDGVFLPEQTQWDQGTLWWDEHGVQGKPSVTITLDQYYFIDSFIVQADNNDTYRIEYYDSSSLEWVNAGAISGWGMMTRPEIFMPDPVFTNALKISAIGGDDWYSLSEVQAFGAPVPEPATMLLFGTGLIGLAGFRRKKSKK